MSDQKPARQMFPESRFVLGIFSPILGVFFCACAYFTHAWQASNLIDSVGKFAVEDILFTFIALCFVGFIASVVGPHRMQLLISRIGGKAAKAGVALILGTVVYIVYYCLVSP